MSLSPVSGRTIGTYRLVAGLGQGGMARVYLALSDKVAAFQKLVVLKVLRGDVASDPEFIVMFLDEARLSARLNHGNVVHTYEVGEDRGRYFIAMEYLEGQSLSSIAARIGREHIPLTLHLRFLADTLAGLHYAHELDDYDGKPLRIVHRDVSPQNVFVTYAGQAKLLDFGIAKASGAISSTRKGIVKGKVGYMAPEQAVGQPVDRRTDIYSVGIMLWEAIARRRLVTRDEPEVLVLERRLAGADPKITAIRPDVPEALAAICDRAMRTDPNERYATAAEMQRDIEQYLKADGPSDPQAIAALLEGSFADDRRQVRGMVEEQVKGIESERESQPRPLLLLGTQDRLSVPPFVDDDDDDDFDSPPTALLPESKPDLDPVRRLRGARGVIALGLGLAVLSSGGVIATRMGRSSDKPTIVQPNAASSNVASASATSATSAAEVRDPPSPQPTSAPSTTADALSSAATGVTSERRPSPASHPARPRPPTTAASVSPSESAPTPEPPRTEPVREPRPKRTVDEQNPY